MLAKAGLQSFESWAACPFLFFQMKTLVTKLFGRFRTAPVSRESSTTRDSRDHLISVKDGSQNATRQQLVQVLLRDLLRKSGIPADWIECQMLVVSRNARSDGMDVRLIIKHWDARLMNYAFAIQQTLHQEIEQFEPNASEWLRSICWQLDMDGTCPYTALPGKAFWQQPLKNAATAPAVGNTGADSAASNIKPGAFYTEVQPTTADQQDPTRDLENMFAEGDHELDRQLARGQTPIGYEKTQPAPL